MTRSIYPPCLFVILAFCLSKTTVAENFAIPESTDELIGELQYVRAREDETLIDIAREYDLGYDQIVRANPGVNRWIPGGNTKILIPHRYLLPNTEHKGIVLNIAELRMYFFPPMPKGIAAESVVSFPVSIGRMDWKTPIGVTKVTKKDRDPAWHPPKSIRDEHAREGDFLPLVVPGGTPDNPLGRFAVRLGFPGYLIHGVDERKAYGIGMRVTHGCIRMYPEDIEKLFPQVSVGMRVELMDQPIKLGWHRDQLYLEVHQPLDEAEDQDAPTIARVSPDEALKFVTERISSDVAIDEREVLRVADEGNGIPQVIGRRSAVIRSIEPEFEEASSSKSKGSEYEKVISKYLSPRARAADLTGSPENAKPIERRLRGHFVGSEVRRYIEDRY